MQLLWRYTTQQCSAVQCSAVKCSLLHFSALQGLVMPAVQFSSVQFSSVHCTSVHCSACSAVQCSAVQSSAIQCSAVQCSAVQWNADGEGHEGRRQLQSCKVRRVSWHPSPQYSQGSNQVLFNIRQENFRPFLCSSVTLMVPPLYSETGWAGELWPKTNLPKWPN